MSNNIKITFNSLDSPPPTGFNILLNNKIQKTQDIITRTILAVNRYKILEIISAHDLNTCIQSLELLFSSLETLSTALNDNTQDKNITSLQEIVNELSSLFRVYGTESFDDLLLICFGSDFFSQNIGSTDLLQKYNIINKYVQPFSYKLLNWKKNDWKKKERERKNTDKDKNHIIILQDNKNQTIDNTADESDNMLDCFDLEQSSHLFQSKVYGIKIIIQNTDQQKTLIINGIVDDIMVDCIKSEFIRNKVMLIHNNKPSQPEFISKSFTLFTQCITIKDLLIYNYNDFYSRYIGYMAKVAIIKQKSIVQITQEFISGDLFGKRLMLIQLLLKSDEHECQYLAYLLYDFLSNDLHGSVDTAEQTLLFDSLPWKIKLFFREAMKQTNTYTTRLTKMDTSKIPLEQQICLMKTDDIVKEKAMVKLKEVRAKTDDTGSKAKQFLDGLLKIPFAQFKEEPILRYTAECLFIFRNITEKLRKSSILPILPFPVQSTYTSMEMRKYIRMLDSGYMSLVVAKLIQLIKRELEKCKRGKLTAIIAIINNLVKTDRLNYAKITTTGKKTKQLLGDIGAFVDTFQLAANLIPTALFLIKIIEHIQLVLADSDFDADADSHTGPAGFPPTPVSAVFPALNDDICAVSSLTANVHEITNKLNTINTYMTNVAKTLDNAVYGHTKAKRQIERIIGQWITGEKTGYCFGFEGPPGVGKTSLAKKGIAYCLEDDDKKTRPFAFIAVGGSANGSTLDGHNYTYVGSNWGRIVDILMDTKCMNPIIFIDELDKVSRTEQGKEIIGILTHLIDPTQNDAFQDKYFNGIDLDLSKALFIFSYNDVDAIDRVLLDRIHRIKFEHLSLADKLVITRTHLLPEVLKKMGLSGVIDLSDEAIEFIIEEYTCESGVRKLKELLFNIVGEINLNLLKAESANISYDIPFKITPADIKTNYLKDNHAITQAKIHTTPQVGLINGLWANSLGRGGMLPIEAAFFPAAAFLDLKLTGMQGDVMKESMTVAKTLAWSLLSPELQKTLPADERKNAGIHIHVPEGATPKDGPSAGTAITAVIYSLLTGRKISNTVAITGEICLQGRVTAIGGLDLKILGGIRAGITHFIFPEDNKKDYAEFREKYTMVDPTVLAGITFTPVSSIQEVFSILLL